MTAEVVDQVTLVRQSWVRAVAAAQSYKYADQVLASAEASAELARRMESVGNFNKLTRARHQAFYADAATQLATAKQLALLRKEELIRLLGLDEDQAKQLVLPERLPNLPKQPMTPENVSKQLSQERLDIQQAKAALNAAAKAQGLNRVTSLTDIELSVKRSSVANHSSSRGYEVGVKLPIFDSTMDSTITFDDVITLYPNPSSNGTISLLFPEAVNTNVQFTVFSINGSLIDNRVAYVTDKNITLDYLSLASGTYILSIEWNRQKVFKKFVIL